MNWLVLFCLLASFMLIEGQAPNKNKKLIEIAEKIKKKELTLAEACRQYGIARSTLRYHVDMAEKLRLKKEKTYKSSKALLSMFITFNIECH